MSLDLSGLPKMAVGEKTVTEGDIIHSARATNEVAITVRGAAKAKSRLLMAFASDRMGKGRMKPAWQPKGQLLAVASTNNDDSMQIQVFSRSGQLIQSSEPSKKGVPLWCEWDCAGATLAFQQEGHGIYLWDNIRTPDMPSDAPPSQPLSLCPQITSAASFCMWSKTHSQLAIGTSAGKVIVFNKKESVMQLHDRKGKHGAPVTCGDWLADNRIGLASGSRVKISKPISESGAQWESQCKFKLSGALSRVPKKFKGAGAPRLLSFSLRQPMYVAVCVGDSYMLVFGTRESAHSKEDLGLTFPEDYGPITGFQWLEDDVLLVALSNGYITNVDLGALVRLRQSDELPSCVKATGTTKVFNDYLSSLRYSTASSRIAVCGDNGFKVIVRKKQELEVLIDCTLDYKLTIGNCIDAVQWDWEGKHLVVTATNGFLWAYEITDTS